MMLKLTSRQGPVILFTSLLYIHDLKCNFVEFVQQEGQDEGHCLIVHHVKCFSVYFRGH